jgi:hypothetical protein
MTLAACAGLLAALASAPQASAHLRSDTAAVDYRATISSPGLQPSPPFVARVYQSDLALDLIVREGHAVVVLGYLGEPLLRIDDRGVAVNAASPTAAAAGLVKGGRRAGSAVSWRPGSKRRAAVWHDPRLRGLPPGVSHGAWSVPLLVDGHRDRLHGQLRRLPRPAGWPWLALAGASAALTAVLALAPRQATRTAALVLAVVAAIASTATAAGFALDTYASPGTWILGADGLVFVAIGLAVLVAGPPHLHVVAAGGLGLIALALGLSKGQVFLHPIVLSALPGWLARLAVAVAACSGLAAAILSGVSYAREHAGVRQLMRP